MQSLTAICDWSKPENVAIEYHNNTNTIKRINYSELEDTKKQIESVLSFVKIFQFIGINHDIRTYCVPALILGIQTRGCGFINLPSTNNTEICSKLKISLLFSKSMILGADLIRELNIHGEMIKLLKYRGIEFISEDNSIGDDKFAYAIQTSGSTGEPKIIRVPNACIVPNILNLKEILSLTKSDKIAQITRLTFDPSIVEIFLSLSSGGTLFFVSNDVMNDPHGLLQLIFQSKVTLLQTTPSLWQYRFSQDEIRDTVFSRESHLRTLLIGGEPFPKLEILRRIKHPENRTRIYNIYGITEVSCWASINEIDLADSDRFDTSVDRNFGKTLSQTIFQVRNENGDVIRDGEGFLYIGSYSRICLIDGEESSFLETPVFRKTGDLVTVNGDDVFYKDRCDRIIKRFGNRVDLTELELAISKLDFVQNCLALWDEKIHKLYLCVSTINSIEGTGETLRARDELNKQLRKLPSSYQPDRIKYLNDFHLNTSGKICRRALMKLFQNTEKSRFEKAANIAVTETAREIFTKIWTNHLTSKTVCGFIENGGTSVIAMQISNELSAHLDREFPELIGLLLRNETLANCHDYVVKKIECTRRANDIQDSSSTSDTAEVRITKKLKHNITYPEKSSEPDKCVWQKCRGKLTGEVSKTDSSQGSIKPRLKIEYTRDLKKCVDASPTVFKYSSGEIYTTVGSHAGVILTKQLNRPDSKTHKINLPDRIEASVLALNRFNAIVGCYDGYVYHLNLITGRIIWKFKTGDSVKCTAVLSDDERSIFVGSYDKYFYSISVKDGSEIWKLKGSEGSVSATPRISSKSYSVVFGTLDGSCMALNQTSGQVIWKNKFQDPIFSAPEILENGDIIFCSVSGEIRCFHSCTGLQIWRYKIDGNVFSHLVLKKNLIENTEDLIVGCNNRNLYCLALGTDSFAPILRYLVSFECPLVSTPYCEGDVLAVADTGGNISLLNIFDGTIFTSLKLNGDVFSSPVITGEFLVVGCRDNNIYVIRIYK